MCASCVHTCHALGQARRYLQRCPDGAIHTTPLPAPHACFARRHSWLLQRPVVLAALTLGVLVPLCSMRSMSGLTVLNAIGLASLAVFAALTVTLAGMAVARGTAHTLPLGPDWPALGSNLPAQLTGGATGLGCIEGRGRL